MAKDEGFFIEIWVVLKKRDEKKKKKKKKKKAADLRSSHGDAATTSLISTSDL